MIAESTKLINGYKESVISLQTEARKAKGTEELINSTKLLNDNVVKGGVEMKRYEVEVQKLKEKTEQLTNSEKAASIEIAKARIELQAAQKATKEAALAKIEDEARTAGLTKNYYSLKAELKAAEKAFKSLSLEEQQSAKGRELINKYTELKKATNATDEAFGNFQHNVGNYEQSIKNAATSINGMKEQLKDLTAKLNTMDVNSDEFKKTKNVIDNLSLAVDQAAGKVDEFGNKEPKNIAKKNFEDTMVTVGILSSSINALSGAFGDNEGAQEALTKATQGLAISQSVANVVKEKGAIVDTIVLAKEKALAISKIVLTGLTRIFGLTSVQAWAAATLGISLLITGIIILIANFTEIINAMKSFFGITNEFAETEAKVKSLTKAMEGFGETTKLQSDRMKAEGKTDQQIFDYKKKRYNEELELNRRNIKLITSMNKTLSEKEKESLEKSAAFVKANKEVQFGFYTEQIALSRSLAEKKKEDNKKQNDEDKKMSDAALAAKRRLTDSSFALLKDGREKELKLNGENYTRQIEDLRRSGDLTTELKDNLLQAQKNNEDKINKEWDSKKLNDQIKADELTLENMKKAGQNTLEFEKDILKSRMEAEILAGGNVAEIKQKYRYMEIDLETQNADKKAGLFAKQLNKEVDLLKNGYSEKQIELKKQFSEGKISKKAYEDGLVKIQTDAELAANAKTIELLKKQLSISELSVDKRAELSKQLADLEIENENAKLDATIEANDKKVQSDEDAAGKRKETAEKLVNATLDLFNSIAEFQTQQSEIRIGELEKELEVSNTTFDEQQTRLDGAIMSDESRAAKKIEIENKKAAAEKAIQAKIMAEKVKQAKWEKAQSIIQAIISTSLGVIAALGAVPYTPANIAFAALTAATGAVNIATIAAQPLPAFEHGGVTGQGLALWGERRAEVAVSPSGDTFIADKPTVSNFEAGTRIYKSVAEYENFMTRQSGEKFSFDYDKFGEKMPQNKIILDSRGLWGIVNKQNERRTLINRNYKRN
jgi:hypothetical protein